MVIFPKYTTLWTKDQKQILWHEHCVQVLFDNRSEKPFLEIQMSETKDTKGQSAYEQRGVSSDKGEVHRATRNLDKGLFPGAFCKILPDVWGGSPEHCNVLHADTAGTKACLGWLKWMFSKNPKDVAGIAVDALVMNVDDV